MKSRLQPVCSLLLVTMMSLGITACGSDNDDNSTPPTGNTGGDTNNNGGNTGGDNTSQATLQGVAAIGAPIINGQVVVLNANGVSANATTTTSGSYSVTLPAAAPYILKVTDNTSGEELYSYAVEPGTANITELTSLALYVAAGQNPNALFDTWTAANQAWIDEDDLNDAMLRVNANLRTLYETNGIDLRYNFFTTPFEANQTGIDRVMDDVVINIDYSVQDTQSAVTITTPGGAFAFNTQVDISDLVVDVGETPSGGIPANSVWRLSGTVTAAGVTQDLSASPVTTFTGQEVPANQSAAEVAISGLSGISSGTQNGVTYSCSFSNVSYQQSINGVIGDAIQVGGTSTCSVTTNGMALPTTTVVYNVIWTRIE